MRNEPWSVNALSLALNVDRRTLVKWLGRADTKPAAEGAHGPLYKLADVVRVLASSPAVLLTDDETAQRFGSFYYQELAAREFAGVVLRVLSKRLPADALRTAREVIADELLAYIEECSAGMKRQRYKRGESPPWASISDRDLGRALRGLIESGCMEDETDDTEAGAA